MLLRQERDLEARAAGSGLRAPDTPPVGGGNLEADRQSESGSRPIILRAAPKAFKYFFPLFHRNARTLIFDRESVGADFDANGTAFRREINGILDQILEQQEQSALVRRHLDFRAVVRNVYTDVHHLRPPRQERHDLPCDIANGRRPFVERASAGDLGDVQ